MLPSSRPMVTGVGISRKTLPLSIPSRTENVTRGMGQSPEGSPRSRAVGSNRWGEVVLEPEQDEAYPIAL